MPKRSYWQHQPGHRELIVCGVNVCAGNNPSGGACTYTLRQGDTFWALSILLGTTLNSVLFLNPNVEPTRLQIGQVVNVPCKPVKRPLDTVDCSQGCSAFCSRYAAPPINGTCAEVAAALSVPVAVFVSLNQGLGCVTRPNDTSIIASVGQVCVDGKLLTSQEDIGHPNNTDRWDRAIVFCQGPWRTCTVCFATGYSWGTHSLLSKLDSKSAAAHVVYTLSV